MLLPLVTTLLMLLTASRGHSLRSPLATAASNGGDGGKSENVSLDFITAHSSVRENQDLELRCVVTIRDESSVVVEWVFAPAELQNAEGEGARVIVSNGMVVNNRSGDHKYNVTIRRRWDAITDFNVEEHYLLLEKIRPSDQGMYACQLLSSDNSVVASKNSLITVVPLHSVFPSSLQSSPHTTDTAVSSDQEVPTLGPITERFVVATRGTNVVLECRDADGNWIYWRKHGDPATKGIGRELRLFRVDRWDSGLYYCSTNTTFSNVTLRVDHPPRVTAVSYGGSAAGVARQAIGHPATLTCKVEAVPVPRITWYKLTKESGAAHPLPQQQQHRQKLHSGDNFSISIDGYKDGLVESSLLIPSVLQEHFGTFVCQADNALGEDAVLITLESSARATDFTRQAAVQDESGIYSAAGKSHQRISFDLIFCTLLSLVVLLFV